MKLYILIYAILSAAFTLSLLAMTGKNLDPANATVAVLVWIASIAATLVIVAVAPAQK